MDELMSVPDELEADEVALLERFADLEGPSVDAEDRMLAAIEAAIEAEHQLADADDLELSASPRPAEDGSRTWTSVAIAVTAFAAGALLTCGLQGEALRAMEQQHAPSVSEMLADDDTESQMVTSPSISNECEPTVVEKKIYIPVPIPASAGDNPPQGDDHDHYSVEPTQPNDSGAVFGAVSDPSTPGTPTSAAGSTSIEGTTWVARRPGASSSGGRSRSGRTAPRSRGRSAVGGSSGGWSPTAGASPSPAGTGTGASPSHQPGAQPGPNPSPPKPGGSKPGEPGPDQPPPDPEQPPPSPDDPPDAPGPNDPPHDPDGPPDDEPYPDEEPQPENDGYEQCDIEFDACLEDSMLICETEPHICGEVSDECFVQHDACLFGEVGEPFPEEDWICEEDHSGCLEAADMICAEDPQFCEEFLPGL